MFLALSSITNLLIGLDPSLSIKISPFGWQSFRKNYVCVYCEEIIVWLEEIITMPQLSELPLPGRLNLRGKTKALAPYSGVKAATYAFMYVQIIENDILKNLLSLAYYLVSSTVARMWVAR